MKTIRLNAGLTQEDLAMQLKVKQSTISMWENNKSKPRYDTLIKLSEILHCEVSDLFKAQENSN